MFIVFDLLWVWPGWPIPLSRLALDVTEFKPVVGRITQRSNSLLVSFRKTEIRKNPKKKNRPQSF